MMVAFNNIYPSTTRAGVPGSYGAPGPGVSAYRGGAPAGFAAAGTVTQTANGNVMVGGSAALTFLALAGLLFVLMHAGQGR